MQTAWWLFRTALSVACVAVGVWLLVDFGSYGAWNIAVGAFAVMMMIATTPWVLLGKQRPPREMSLLTIFCGVGAAIMAGAYVVTPYVMDDCSLRPSPRSTSVCQVFNLLYSVGGNWAVVASFAACAAFFILGGGYLLLRLLRRSD
jgi:hypothetical protein